jgi:fibronectin-binding autotransporter adhesin
MKTNSSPRKMFTVSIFAAGASLFLLAGAAKAQTGVWTNNASGTWSTPANWLNGIVAGGPSSTAYFTNDITSDVTVHLDTVSTNQGNLVFGDGDVSSPANWFLDNNGTAANILTLSASISPTITVNALGAGKLVNISAIITGNNLTETGPGLLVPSGANTFTNMTINGGTVVWNTANGAGSLGAAVTNNTITLTNGATLIRSNTANNLVFGINVKGTDTIDCSSTAATSGNLNGFFLGDGTLNIILGSPGVITNTLTTGGSGAWNSNVWANFSGTVVLSGGGNLRFDINNANTFTFGSKLATFDLGTGNNTMNERSSGSLAQHTTFIGALRGGFGTVISCNSKAGDTNTLQVGDNNLSTTFNGTIANGSAAVTALTKSGAGTLTLGGTNLYSGATVIKNGTLALGTTGSISNTPSITVLSNSMFDVSAYGTWTPAPNRILAGNGVVTGAVSMTSAILSPGYGTNFGRLTFANDLALPGITVNMEIGFGTNDSVAVTGNLNLSGTTTINLAQPPGFSLIPNSTNVLFQWGGALTGDLSNLQLVYSSQSASADIVLQTNLVTKQIILIVTNNVGNQIVWKGNSGNNIWDHGTANWLHGASTVLFTNLDDVTFNDSGVASVPVSLSDTVVPASITVSNNSNAYTFTSSGGQISGVTGLTKNGTNTLTVLEDNSLSGVVTINAGIVVVGSGSVAAGSLGTASIVNNGTLVYNRDTSVTLSSVIQGSGTLVQNSTNGTLIATSDNNSGNVWVQAGTLQLGDGSSGSSHGSFTGTITNSATLNYNYDASLTIPNMLAGNGVVNYNEVSGDRTYTFPLTITNESFTGTMNIAAGITLHANTGNSGYQFGNGAQVNVSYYAQAWLDSIAGGSATSNYNSSFTIQGPGWAGDSLPIGHVTGDLVGWGALRLFNNTLTGNITLAGNARIGGNSSGSTIQGQISDGGNNYQLEIVSGSANLEQFILTLAPAAGPNAYASTLITSGTLQAGNTNAVTNTVTMTAFGRMRLNGCNITLASLSGGDPATGGGVTNCMVYNFNTTNAATLSVGKDNSSTAFNGIFADGTNQPLGLTKIGSGTLTLSGNSTNTGPVTVSAGTLSLSSGTGGSGSFSNAALFAVSSGAILNVNSRGDQTLTLNNGQTLKGSGTVNGNVSALAGSTVNPGDSVGTLTVQQNVTLAGTLLMELNRTNAQNCDHLVSSSGTITYGGTLSVTNVGPALHATDYFQLFSSGVSGFAAVNLQTNDTVNNVKYTWYNTISSNGRITVATVTNLVNPTPTNITARVNGSNLELSWPADHTGWTLQVQTNNLNVGLSNNWVDMPGSTSVDSVTNTINPTNGAVFYRMKL